MQWHAICVIAEMQKNLQNRWSVTWEQSNLEYYSTNYCWQAVFLLCESERVLMVLSEVRPKLRSESCKWNLTATDMFEFHDFELKQKIHGGESAQIWSRNPCVLLSDMTLNLMKFPSCWLLKFIFKRTAMFHTKCFCNPPLLRFPPMPPPCQIRISQVIS